MVDKVTPVTLSVSEDAEHTIRTAVKGTEDEIYKLVTNINKVVAQLEGLIMTRTARDT
jgi:hypothetical protein